MKILEILTEKRRIGNLGERAAKKYLILHGYRIIKMNYSAPGYEIDIIAENKTTIAFVEVKTRSAQSPLEPRPASSVTPEKQRKIISAAGYFLAARKNEKQVRFDVIEVYLEKMGTKEKIINISHLENAFNRNTAFKRK